MLRSITIRQFQEWRAYADLEPFDEERADARAAQVVQAIHTHSRSKATPKSLKDCMLRYERPKKLTVEERRAQIRDIIRSMAAAPKTKRRRKKAGA
jgi:hypothetical protein